jgi:proteasome lid subunit RPN8/RPN11
MTQPFKIRITPPLDPLPCPAALPLEQARRWFSPHEQGGVRPSFPVFLTQAALLYTNMHASSRLDVEVGGLLAGQACLDPQSGLPFLIIIGAISARFTHQSSVHLTFTQNSLVDLYARMEEQYPGRQIVGWYHTHPSMGVFLSQYDTWLHEHFFPEPWQVALVIEPVNRSSGFFIRQQSSRLDPDIYYGFYELGSLPNRNCFPWSNLHAGPERSIEIDHQEGDLADEQD